MADYLPLGNFRQSHVKESIGAFDVAFIKTSPPDENGFLSMVRRSGPTVPRSTFPGGSSAKLMNASSAPMRKLHPHVEVAALVEHNPADDREAPIAPRSQEVIDATEIVGTILAAELINDRDTLQIGIGDVTSALALFLGDKHDLGIQTELIPAGSLTSSTRAS